MVLTIMVTAIIGNIGNGNSNMGNGPFPLPLPILPFPHYLYHSPILS